MARIYVVVQSGRRPGAATTIMRWARALVPAAVLLGSPAALPLAIEEGDSVISIDADEVESGPLALADAIARSRSAADPEDGSSTAADLQRSVQLAFDAGAPRFEEPSV